MVGVDDFVFNLADGQGGVLTYEAILVDTQTKASGTRKDDYTLAASKDDACEKATDFRGPNAV